MSTPFIKRRRRRIRRSDRHLCRKNRLVEIVQKNSKGEELTLTKLEVLYEIEEPGTPITKEHVEN